MEMDINVGFSLENKKHEENKIEGEREASPEVQFKEFLEYDIVRYLEFKFIGKFRGV